MKNFGTIFFISSVFSAQQSYYRDSIVGSQKIKTMTFPVESFSRIFASFGQIELDPEQSSNFVIVQGDENILDEFSISTFCDTLYIGPKNPLNQIFPSSLKISVGINDYSKLSLAGGAFYKFVSQYTGDKFRLEMSGQAGCMMDCNVNELEVVVGGDSRLSCAGKANQYEVLIYENALVDISKLLGKLVYSKQDGKAQFTNLSLVKK